MNTMSIQKINPPTLLKFDGLAQVVVAAGGARPSISPPVGLHQHLRARRCRRLSRPATQALHNLRTAVEAAGGTVENIVSSTVYIKGLNGQASEQVMAAMATAIDGKPFPAHAFSMIGVEALSGRSCWSRSPRSPCCRLEPRRAQPLVARRGDFG
jgi:2-iminobutanoate/2-iminopropanoate deaminase